MTIETLSILHNQISTKLQGLHHRPYISNWIETLQYLRNAYPSLEISLGLPGYGFQVELRHTAPNPADPLSCYSRSQIGIILHPELLRPVPKDPIPDPVVVTDTPFRIPINPCPINPFPASDTHQPGNLPVWLL